MIPSQLILQSGESFPGLSPDWQKGNYFGEVIFTTGMTGYVESLTDPSYQGQILSFTYPLIGNYGVPSSQNWESERIQASGVVASWICPNPSHREEKMSFLDWMKQGKIPLIMGVDTRKLAHILRKKGTALGAISTGKEKPEKFFNPNRTHLVKQLNVSRTKQSYGSGKYRIIAVDCGMKENILRSLLKFPVRIERVPFDYDYSEEEYDGVLLSNGPGNPSLCQETISVLKKIIGKKKAIFGICLGAQLLALAIGAKTYKLKWGHRGQNHPCFDLEEKKAILTSQNHGYAIDEKSLPSDWKVLFRSLNDQSVEGIVHEKLPYFAVQFHPESSPGPTDAFYLFEKFYSMFS